MEMSQNTWAVVRSKPAAGSWTATIDHSCHTTKPRNSQKIDQRRFVPAIARPVVPERYRMGALIRLVCEHLERRVEEIPTGLGPVELRGRSVVLDGRVGTLAPAPLAIFRALVAARGGILGRAQLVEHLPEAANEHALDMAMTRLRQSLPDPRLVATVVKRGYRLQV